MAAGLAGSTPGAPSDFFPGLASLWKIPELDGGARGTSVRVRTEQISSRSRVVDTVYSKALREQVWSSHFCSYNRVGNPVSKGISACSACRHLLGAEFDRHAFAHEMMENFGPQNFTLATTTWAKRPNDVSHVFAAFMDLWLLGQACSAS